MARWDPAHVTPRVRLCIDLNFRSVVPKVCLAKVPFWSDMNTERGEAL